MANRKKKKIAVIGAGIFGLTAAIKLAENGHTVEVFEKNSDILTAASGINQYRLHQGYHYPRGPSTAQACRDHVIDFYEEFPQTIVGNTDQHYCISSRDSFVSGNKYIDFCKKLELWYEECYPEFINRDSIDICIRVKEDLFDHKILEKVLWQRIKKHSIKIHFDTDAKQKDLSHFNNLIIATYTNNNQFLERFPTQMREYQYELCEKLVVKLPPEFLRKGLVVMDGPFLCFDPLGNTGYHVMGHVVHAIHQTNIGYEPEPFSDERYETLLNHGIIENPPITNFPKFIEAATEFLHGIEKAEHIGSMFTYRTVLPFMDNTDERPTIVEIIDDRVISLFSGKIPTCVNAAKQVVKLVNGD